jgi:DNA-binding Lrp family transcriptional regulator
MAKGGTSRRRARHYIDVLRILQENNTLNQDEIALRIGVSKSRISKIVSDIRENHTFIKSETAVIDPEVFGLKVLAFIHIVMKESFPGNKINEVEDFLIKYPNVQEIHHVTSDRGIDLIVKIRLSETGDIFKFMEELGNATSNISRTETLTVIRTVRETLSISLKDEDERLLT